ncbi:hypothetical protein F4777DRAFT_514149 [Nemania sp. FL0916]|nr:hypothetical protein F4777DRAFT_514149 [Nemania sp. FL0916]
MTTPPFTPYWRPINSPMGPNSWVFFAVAQIDGRHRAVAVVSSPGTTEPIESLQGYPLTACCERSVTIFADPANYRAIRSELALAESYYVRDGGREYRPEPVELPDGNRRNSPVRKRPWDHSSTREFPFIAACLLQGVGFTPRIGRTAPVSLEPLATVYRDDSIEWGMVVLDITDLDAVRYGIVGFTVSMAKFVPSLEAERIPFSMGARGPGAFEFGDLRVMDEIRPRRAMSAAEYMAKFDYEVSEYGYIADRLDHVSLVDAAAMSLVWPTNADDDLALSPTRLPRGAGGGRSLQEQAIMRLIQETQNLEDFDMSIFDNIRFIPDFEALLRSNLLRQSNQLGHTRSAGRLLRLAFTDNKHLGLERMKVLSAEAISAALEGPEITSISLCIDSVRGIASQLVEALSRSDTLRDIYLLQSPFKESDALSVQIFEALAARPQMLLRTNVMISGACSAALRRKFWLPTELKDGATQLEPLEVFPVQQILVRQQQYGARNIKFDHGCVYLGDGLLKPERFAAGFLLWLSTLMSWPDEDEDSKMHLFSFSSASASLASNLFSTSQISPILAENFTRPMFMSNGDDLPPRVRDLVPGGWTVLVSQEIPRPHGRPSYLEPYYIRYAFVRPDKKRIVIDDSSTSILKQDDIEVVGLKGFLSATSPETDPADIDRRLHEVSEKLASKMPWGPLPDGIEPLSVLTRPEAAEMLVEFLGQVNKLSSKMTRKENSESK